MTGCDRCGAQALAAEATCPVCGLALREAAPSPAARRPAPHIPVRRHGTVPLPPVEVLAAPEPFNLAALGLGALGFALIATGIGYWLW